MPQAIMFDAQLDAAGTDVILSIAFWLDAPANRIRPKPNFVSAVPTTVPNVPSTIAAALQAGTIVEVVEVTGQLPTAGLTVSAIETAIQNRLTALQTALNNSVFAGQKFIGAYFSGSAWTLPT